MKIYDLFELNNNLIHCFFGPPASGKTTICLEYLSKHIKKNNKIFYIDTENGFSIERIKQINSNINFKNIIIYQPKNFEEQHKILEEIKIMKLKKLNVSLIIVDSLVMLYRLNLSENPSKINQKLAYQLSILREIAITNNMPILVTNQMYREFDSKQTKMVGGSIISYWAKIIFELELSNIGKKKLKLIKHPYKFEKKPIKYEIINKGIEFKKGFF